MLPPHLVPAATLTWQGRGADANWSSQGNWEDGLLPAAGDSLIFDGAVRLATVNDRLPGTSIAGLTFGTPALSFSLSGSSIALAGPVSSESTCAQSIALGMSLAATQEFEVVSSRGVLTVSGSLSGAGGMTKAGSGLLVLSGSSSYGGVTTLSGGTVSIGSLSSGGIAGNLGQAGNAAANLVFDGGTLRFTGISSETNRNFTIVDGKSAAFDVTVNNTQVTFTGGAAASTGGLVKTGAGILTLGAQNLYTGDTVVNQGTLKLDFAKTGSPANNIVHADSRLVLGGYSTVQGSATTPLGMNDRYIGGATLEVVGINNGNSSQTFDGLLLRPGQATVRTVPTGTGGVLLNLGAITREAGSTVNFVRGGAQSATNTITTTTGNQGATGILGGWAVFNGSDFAANDGSGNIVAYTGYVDVAASGAVIANGTSSNVRLNSGVAGTNTLAAGVTNINTLLQNTAVSSTLDIGTGNTLRLGTQGGILVGATRGALTINGGRLTAGGDTYETAGEINLQNFSNLAGNALTISSVIANNNELTGAANSTGGGVVSVNITGFNNTNGNNTLVINGTNTYSGGTTINGGRVSAGNSAAFGTGAVTVINGGQAWLNTGGTWNNNFFLGGAGTSLIGDTPGALRITSGGTFTGSITLLADAGINFRQTGGAVFTGVISGAYNLTLTANGAPGGDVRLSNTGNNWTGNLIVDQKRLILGNSEVLSHGDGVGDLVLTDSASTILDLNGNNETINGLVGNGTSSTVENRASGTSATLAVGAGDASAAYGGTIRNNHGEVGATGIMAFTKTGSGIQVLSGMNTYTGVTNILEGTLQVSGSLNGTGAGTVSVASGATLALDGGTVNGEVNISDGAVLRGVSTTATIGTLNNGVFIDPGGAINFVNNVAGTLSVTGDFVLANASEGIDLAFDIGGAGGLGDAINLLTGTLLADPGELNMAILLNNIGSIADGQIYNLFTFGAGMGDDVGGFYIDPASNLGFYTATLNYTDTAVQVIISGTDTPVAAYWTGALGDAWNAQSGQTANWATTAAGTTNTEQLPGATTDVYFAANGAANLSNVLGQDFTIRSLNFLNGTGAVTVGGTHRLTLLAGGIVAQSGAGAARIEVAELEVGAAQTWLNESATPVVVTSWVLGSDALRTEGNFTLITDGTYTGVTTVASGTLRLEALNALGGGTSATVSAVQILAGATLDLFVPGDNQAFIFDSHISGAGTLNISSRGETRIASDLSGFVGVLQISAYSGPNGKLTVTAATGNSIHADAIIKVASNGAVYFQGGTVKADIEVAGPGNNEPFGALRLDGATVTGNITMMGDTRMGSNNSGTISGVISGDYDFTKGGGGTLILAGANTFSGETSVAGGVLDLHNSLALQNSTVTSAGFVFSSTVASRQFTFGGLSGVSSVVLANNATTPESVALTVGNNDEDTEYSGALSGAGSVDKVGDGIWTVTGANLHTGGTTVSEGVFMANNLAGSATGSGNVVVKNGATLGGFGTVGNGAAAQNITFEAGSLLSVGDPETATLGVGEILNLATSGSGVITLGGSLEFDIFANYGGTDNLDPGLGANDRLIITGETTVQLSGTLSVADLAGDSMDWLEGDEWQLIDWSAVITGGPPVYNGSFTLVDMPELSEEWIWVGRADASGYYITVAAIPEPGRMVLLLFAGATLCFRRRRTAVSPAGGLQG
jgi:autotransporter-associated beta strand protein